MTTSTNQQERSSGSTSPSMPQTGHQHPARAGLHRDPVRDRRPSLEWGGTMTNTTVSTRNAVQRTLLIRKGPSIGTAFTLDRHDQEYVLTARLVTDEIKDCDSLEIRHGHQWRKCQVQVIGIGYGSVDVAVLRHPSRLTPSRPPEISSWHLGQRVGLLGFPFGWDQSMENLNNGYRMPFVKSGIVSAVPGSQNRTSIDAHGNHGFSGGSAPLRFDKNDSCGHYHQRAGKPRNRIT